MCLLFTTRGFTQQTSQADDPMYLLSTRRQGTWADSETERALKSLNSFCKNFGGTKHFVVKKKIFIIVLIVLLRKLIVDFFQSKCLVEHSGTSDNIICIKII